MIDRKLIIDGLRELIEQETTDGLVDGVSQGLIRETLELLKTRTIDRQALIKYLPCHATFGTDDLCIECPYNPRPGKIWEFGCAHGQDRMIKDTISILQALEV